MRIHRSVVVGGLVLVLGAGEGCGDESNAGKGGAPEGDAGVTEDFAFTDALTAGETVPPRHKCPMSVFGSGMGDNLSPPLAWSGVPADAQSLALVLTDTRYGVFHWALWDIPPDTRSLPEGIPAGFEVDEPPGARQGGAGGDDAHAYFGPCSDAGPFAGVYEYRLHALNVASLELTADADAETIAAAIEGASVESAAWEATPE